MVECVVIILDTVKVHSNKSEWRPVNRASTTYQGCYLEESGDGEVIKKLLSRLYTENKCPITAYVEVRRGETPIFKSMPLKDWLFPPDRRPEHLKKEKKDD